jgi:LPS O-antigen subunit length determinant protein (WzzB/FepE family)
MMTTGDRMKSNSSDGCDEIMFNSIFAVLWKKKIMISIVTFVATFLAFVIAFLFPKSYRSEGIIQLGNPSYRFLDISLAPIKMYENKKQDIRQRTIGIALSNYKSISSQFLDTSRLYSKAMLEKSFMEEDLDNIRKEIKSAFDLEKFIKPVYAFAKDDARDISQLPQDESNSVLSLKIFFEGHTPEKAMAYVKFLGEYIRDCLLYVTLYNYVVDGYSNAITGTNKIENDISAIRFQLSQNTNKKKDIEAILSHYPEAAKIESRQLVSLQDGGSRFLSPITQLVGIESNIADLHRDLAGLEREADKVSIRTQYFSHIHERLDTIGNSGDALYSLLKLRINEIFDDKDINRDEIKEVLNSLNISLHEFELIFYKNTRFISGPTFPADYSKPRISIIVIGTFFTSLFLLMVVSIIMHWWEFNKQFIISGRERRPL